jgi:hypothetical protein
MKSSQQLAKVFFVTVLVFSGGFRAMADTGEYQFHHNGSLPTAEGWSKFASGGTDSTGPNALALTDPALADFIYYRMNSTNFSSFNAFELRAKVRVGETTVGSGDVLRPSLVLRIGNGTATNGRNIQLGLARSNNVTTIGFVGDADSGGTYDDFLDTTFTTNTLDFLEILLSKPAGTGASISLFVNGANTGISIAANDTRFQLFGSQTLRWADFGMPIGTSAGSSEVWGVTFGNAGDSAPVIIPESSIAGALMLGFMLLRKSWLRHCHSP